MQSLSWQSLMLQATVRMEPTATSRWRNFCFGLSFTGILQYSRPCNSFRRFSSDLTDEDEKVDAKELQNCAQCFIVLCTKVSILFLTNFIFIQFHLILQICQKNHIYRIVLTEQSYPYTAIEKCLDAISIRLKRSCDCAAVSKIFPKHITLYQTVE